MNQDYQLSTNPQANGDFWTQNGSGILANAGIGNTGYGAGSPMGASTQKHSPVRKAHRLLRGRYPVVFLLAGLGAAIGGTSGYLAMPPKYESSGLVAINPLQANGGPQDGVVPMLSFYIRAQVGFLGGSSVATEALKDQRFIDAWQHAYGTTPLPSVAEFMAAVTPTNKGNSLLIDVSFGDKKKEVAEAGAQALLAAYWNQHGSGDDKAQKMETRALVTNDLANQDAKLTLYHQRLDQLNKVYGTTNLSIQQTAIQQTLTKYRDELSQAQLDYEHAVAAQNGTAIKKEQANPEDIYELIAGVDRNMAALLIKRKDAAQRLDDLTAANIGPRHPTYLTAVQLLKDAQDKVSSYEKEYLVRNGNHIPFEIAQGLGTDGNIEMMKDRIDGLKNEIKSQNEQALQYGAVDQQITDIRADITQAEAKRLSDLRTQETIDNQIALNHPISISPPGEAGLASDKRKLVAGLGFGFGGLIPLSLILLYGMTENRFRFSDDANAHDLAGVTLLGILPNLPDRLSDPQQAGIAAHCVHQIRTMLQISRSNDEPQVIAITSAASGDGKTSLTLALGLSYAACGARTLLIDCDLIAAGLTHRLNVNSTDGILESVANRALLEYVRTTDIADVAVLPVGTTHAHHASTLSPVALRRLLSEAKKHFDLIIVDTGPILGSIEASLVCAAADRTILAVARNQQRPLVEKSIAHLQAIGAQLAGVVFNRAQARDFERSMSGLALRSRPLPGSMNATPSQSTAAKAVAGSFKRAG